MRTIHTETYYTTMEYLLDVYDKTSRKMGVRAKNMKEFQEWKEKARYKLWEITGLDQMQKCDLNPKLLESKKMDGYKRDKIIIQTEPGVWMPFYVLIPGDLKIGEKRQCMIAPHGHGSGGKYSTAGRKDIPAVKDAILHYNYDYGVKYVKEGYIAFCPDARAFGERREWTKQSDGEEDFMNSTCYQLNHMAICLGQSLTGMWTWDLMRLIDYIESREDCYPTGIGCGGLSGGGLQTLWISAMDERIKCAVVSGYFYGYKDSLLRLSGNCGCNYVPNLWKYIDMGDLGALIAPRPLLIETGNRDPLNGERGLINVTEQVEITKTAYKLLGVEDRLYHHIFEGEHLWNGEETYKFLNKYLKGRT